MTEKEGMLIVISGPSGVGKSTVISNLLSQKKDIYFSISFTTRRPREGEVEGMQYHFVQREEFERMIATGELLEYAEYVGNYYGTSLKLLKEKLATGIDVLLDIEVQGAMKIREKYPQAIFIFIVPPSFEELVRRLRNRNSEGEESIASRLQTAREEYRHIANYDYLVINENVTDAVEALLAIFTAERSKVKNRLYLTNI